VSRLHLAFLPFLLLLLGMSDESFRFSRTVENARGVSVLDLPLDVLSAAAPGLRDVRLLGEQTEIGYELEERIVTPALRLPLLDVESEPGKETIALVDRGEHPGLSSGLSLEVAGDAPFIKPLVIEAGEDRTNFRRVAGASVFRTEGGASLRVHFAPSDRRYLRLRFDDRLSPPIQPSAAVLEPTPPSDRPGVELPLPIERAPAAADSGDRFEVRLPNANLPARSLTLETSERLFSREVRVYEQLLFRGELSRRLVGEGRIERTTSGSEMLSVPLAELTSARLELEVERAGPALALSGARLLLRAKRLIFVMPENGGLRLVYGSHTASAPRYDVGRFLANGVPAVLSTATLGPAVDRGLRPALPVPERAVLVDGQGFRSRRVLELPKQGNLAYLDLAGVAPSAAHGVRLLDASGHQVPFVVEAAPRRIKTRLALQSQVQGRTTSARLTGFDPGEPLVGLELDARSPALFQRTVQVFETTRDARGPTGKRLLASARWEKRPEQAEARLLLSLSPPMGSELIVEIDNGDNPPLVLGEASAEVSRARIDFVFRPGETLTLLSSHPNPVPAQYDLELLAHSLIESPALPATLAAAKTPAATTSPADERRPVWFWIAFAAAGALVFAALARVLKGERDSGG